MLAKQFFQLVKEIDYMSDVMLQWCCVVEVTDSNEALYFQYIYVFLYKVV